MVCRGQPRATPLGAARASVAKMTRATDYAQEGSLASGLTSRVAVADAALQLFRERGYEETTAAHIAEAAGISRSTFFRQFGSKDDVLFADHDELLQQVEAFLAASDDDPRTAVCRAAELVFERFASRRDVIRVRDAVVRNTPALRDREIVTTTRYEKAFAAHLRAHAGPDAGDAVHLEAIQFAALVTSTHNFVLRRMLRGDAEATAERLREALAHVAARWAPARSPAVVVVAIPEAGATPERIAEVVEQRLRLT